MDGVTTLDKCCECIMNKSGPLLMVETGHVCAVHDMSTFKLPIIHHGLITPVPHIPAVPENKLLARVWAGDIRKKIDECNETGEPVGRGDVITLRTHLVQSFVTAIDANTTKAWRLLNDILTVLSPYAHFFDEYDRNRVLKHYVETVVTHVRDHPQLFYDIPLLSALDQLFPELVEEIKMGPASPAHSQFTHKLTPRKKIEPSSPSFRLPDGTNPFSTKVMPGEGTLRVKPLKLSSLKDAATNVACDLLKLEQIWMGSGQSLLDSLKTKLFQESEKEDDESDFELEELHSESAHITQTPRPLDTSSQPVYSGREAVELFTRYYHCGKIDSLYLNHAPNRHFRPYDLVSVDKDRVNANHYVFSTFGVLCVYAEGHNESVSLTDWLRQAVLWKALQSIPFFRNYLIRKAFTSIFSWWSGPVFYLAKLYVPSASRWRGNKARCDFERRQRELSSKLIFVIPGYGAALLHIMRLLKEVVTVELLPFDQDVQYSIYDFMRCVVSKRMEAEKILDRFYEYKQQIINMTVEETFKRHHDCDVQVQKLDKLKNESIYVQRINRERKVANLAKAAHTAGLLGHFTLLVNQIIIEHIICMTKTHILRFRTEVMSPPVQDQDAASAPSSGLTIREGLFKVNLHFSKNDTLGLSPSKKKLTDLLPRIFSRIPGVLIQSLDKSSLTDSLIDLLGLPRPDTFSEDGVDGLSTVTAKQVAHHSVLLHSSEETGDVDEGNDDDKDEKEDHDHGMTPGLVHPKRPLLMVQGDGFLGQYNPLKGASLVSKINGDAAIQVALDEINDMMADSLTEISEYIETKTWLGEIHVYCNQWQDSELDELKGQAAYTIEKKMMSLRQWSDRMRNFDRTFVTENRLILVDCSEIHDRLRQRVDSIYNKVVSTVATNVCGLAKDFVSQMGDKLEVLRNKRTAIWAFAEYAQKYQDYKKMTPTFQQQLDYNKTLFEVVRVSARQLKPDEETLEESMISVWELFLFHMHDAAEFINTETPLMLQKLESLFKEKVQEAYDLCEEGTSGKCLDPNNPTSMILTSLKEIGEKFFCVKETLQNISSWRQVVEGEGYDISFIDELESMLDTRQALWKYYEVTLHTLRDWDSMLFKKFSAKNANDKLHEWTLVSRRLQPKLPAQDEVFARWQFIMKEFKSQLPILNRLGHEALKERHWRDIFVGIGSWYNPRKNYTIHEIIGYKMDAHRCFIGRVFKEALAEFDIEHELSKIRKRWLGKRFQLAKYIPRSVIEARAVASQPRRFLRSHKFRIAQAEPKKEVGLDITDDIYTLVHEDIINYELEDSLITIDVMLTSPFVAVMREEAENWRLVFAEIDEILQLWIQYQKMWLTLLKVFENPALYNKDKNMTNDFLNIYREYVDFMTTVVNDPRVIAITRYTIEEKITRPMQGPQLRKMFQNGIISAELILRKINHLIDETRASFPRLYFLADTDIVSLLSVTRDPQALVPFAVKCFPGMQSLTFLNPNKDVPPASSMELDLHADKLEVDAIRGEHNETLELVERVLPTESAATWLADIEVAMKRALAESIQMCVIWRTTNRMPLLRLKFAFIRLNEQKGEQQSASLDGEDYMHHIDRHWIIRLPMQGVLLADAIHWSREVQMCFDEKRTGSNRKSLPDVVTHLTNRNKLLVEIMKICVGSIWCRPDVKSRLVLNMMNLIGQAIYHRDITNSLAPVGSAAANSFDWLKIMKYEMEVTQLLHSAIHVPPEFSSSGPSILLSSSNSKLRQCTVNQLNMHKKYQYEYYGPVSNLIITPLTDRAFLSLSTAMKAFNCGTLVGPSGSGKSATVREFARLMGHYLVTLNGCLDLTFQAIIHHLTGIVRANSWLLIDDAHNLSPGLFSAIAQQLNYLKCSAWIAQSKIGTPTGSEDTTSIEITRHRSNSVGSCSLLRTPSSQITVKKRFISSRATSSAKDTEETKRAFWAFLGSHDSVTRSNLVTKYTDSDSERPMSADSLNHSVLDLEPNVRHAGTIMFNGIEILANCNYACFMTLVSTNQQPNHHIPHNAKRLMRPCALIKPDSALIITSLLHSHGFTNFRLLAQKLLKFLSDLSKKVLKRNSTNVIPFDRDMRIVTHIVESASNCLFDPLTDSTIDQLLLVMSSNSGTEKLSLAEKEEYCIVRSLHSYFSSQMRDDQQQLHLRSTTNDVFPTAFINNNQFLDYDKRLVSAIREQLSEDHSVDADSFIFKILQLYSALQLHKGVIVAGPPGAGKSTCIQVLSRAYNFLARKIFLEKHGHRSTINMLMDSKLQNISTKVIKIMRTGVKLHDETTPTGSQCVVHTKSQKWGVKNEMPEWVAEVPKVKVTSLYPSVYDPEELYGHYAEDGRWQEGILVKLIKEMNSKSDDTVSCIRGTNKMTKQMFDMLQWLVLDGNLSPSWMDGLNGLLGDTRRLSVLNRETVYLTERMSVICETSDLSVTSPSLISRCTIIYCPHHLLSYMWLYERWAKSARARWLISKMGMDVLSDLATDLFEPTVEFLTRDSRIELSANISKTIRDKNAPEHGVQEVDTFIKIFAAILDKHMLREKLESKKAARLYDESDDPSSSVISQSDVCDLPKLKKIFAFSYIWSFGGHIRDGSQPEFDKLARQLFISTRQPISFPQTGSVFDYCIDVATSSFIPWTEVKLDRTLSLTPSYVITPDTYGYVYLIGMMVEAGHPVLVTGNVGVGKSALFKHLIRPKIKYSHIAMSTRVSATILQKLIVSYISAKGQHSSSDREQFFIDDLNAASCFHDSPPTLELLRQILTQKGTYNFERKIFQALPAINVCAAATTPASLASDVNLKNASLHSVFDTGSSMKTIAQLWMHECNRIFGDRISTAIDAYWFENALVSTANKYFCCERTPKDFLVATPDLEQTSLDESGRPTSDMYDTSADPSTKNISPGIDAERESPTKTSLSSKSVVDREDIVSAKTKTTSSISNDLYDGATSPDETVRDTSTESSSTSSADDTDARDALLLKGLRKSPISAKVATMFYTGPLLSEDELLYPHKNTRDIIFCKDIQKGQTDHTGQLLDVSYTAVPYDALTTMLYNCLNSYNKQLGKHINVTFFKESVYHIARLTRVLGIPGGHAVLLGSKHSAGRTTLTRLAGFISGSKLYEAKLGNGDVDTDNIVMEAMKGASIHAGTQKSPTLLLVHESVGLANIGLLYLLMKQGTLPDLLSESEMEMVACKITGGSIQGKRFDKMKQIMERFTEQVKIHLHVVVCLRSDGSASDTMLKVMRDYPELLRHCVTVDTYRPWDRNTYAAIAHHRLSSPQVSNLPWNEGRRTAQIQLTCEAMAYMHLSAEATVERIYKPYHAQQTFYNPKTFNDFIDLFSHLAVDHVHKQEETIKWYGKAMKKVADANVTIENFERDAEDLVYMLKEGYENVERLKEKVEAKKEQFVQSLDICKEQELVLDMKEKKHTAMESRSQLTIDLVSPTYEIAKSALSYLDPWSIEELRTYRQPPECVQWVISTLCLLFGKPPTWEEGKLLLIRENFINDLIFFDKKNVSLETHKKLEKYVEHPDFDPEFVKKSSLAAASICKWIHALFVFVDVSKNLVNNLHSLKQAEEDAKEAQSTMGKMRMRATCLKKELQESIQCHSFAVQENKIREKKLQTLRKNIEKYRGMVASMHPMLSRWISQRSAHQEKRSLSIGESLMAAASICYFGPIDCAGRYDLESNWLQHCRTGEFAFDATEWTLDGYIDTTETAKTRATRGVTLKMPIYHSFNVLPLVKNSDFVLQTERFISTMNFFSGDKISDDSEEKTKPSLLKVTATYKLQEIISDFEELSQWNLKGLSTDIQSLQNALILQMYSKYEMSRWPLVIDPDNQAETWIQHLHAGRNINDTAAVPENVAESESSLSLSMSDNSQPSTSNNNQDNRTNVSTIQTCRAHHTKYFKQYKERERSGQAVSMVQSGFVPPFNNIWSVDIDDPMLDWVLVNSIVHGLTVLVKFVERKPLPSILKVLLEKHTFSNEDGGLNIVVNGDTLSYNSHFYLYLVSSMPLFMKGVGCYELPLENTCVVDMSASDVAILKILLKETMKIERKDLQSQRLMNDISIFHCSVDIMQQMKKIVNDMIDTQKSILNDTKLLASVLSDEANLEKMLGSLEENYRLHQLLDDASAPYTPMVTEITLVYSLLRQMRVISPYYYMPFSQFFDYVSEVLNGHDCGKNITGDPMSRAKELCVAVTKTVYKHIVTFLFQQDAVLFSLLLVLERLHLREVIDTSEMDAFLYGIKQDRAGCMDVTHESNDGPDWLSGETWSDICKLSSEPSYSGLKISFTTNSLEWQEYFYKPVSLVNPVPDPTFLHLNMFQKAFLWKIATPEKFASVAKVLIATELGQIISANQKFTLDEVYLKSNSTRPILLILPKISEEIDVAGNRYRPYDEPVHDIKQIACKYKMDGKLKIVNYGIAEQEMSIIKEISTCMANGFWLVLQNYHLSEGIDSSIFETLVNDPRCMFDGRNDDDVDRPATPVKLRNKPRFYSPRRCTSFRLFVTTSVDQPTVVPAVLIKRCQKITLEQSMDVRDNITSAFNNLSGMLASWNPSDESQSKQLQILRLALLHVTLAQRCHFGTIAWSNTSFWSATDLESLADRYRALDSFSCAVGQLANKAITSIYSDHCIDLYDAQITKAIGRLILTAKANKTPSDIKPPYMAIVNHILDEARLFDVSGVVSKLENITPKTYCIPDNVGCAYMTYDAASLRQKILQVSGTPVDDRSIYGESHNLMKILDEIETCVTFCIHCTATSRNYIRPLATYLHYEMEDLCETMKLIKSDVALIRRSQNGEITASSDIRDIILHLQSNKVPPAWTVNQYPSNQHDVRLWSKDLGHRMNMLHSYLSQPSLSYDLSVFSRPDCFLQAFLDDEICRKMLPVGSLVYNTQFVVEDQREERENGFYINHLKLHNAEWDFKNNTLVDSATHLPNRKDVTLPSLWLQPRAVTETHSGTHGQNKTFACPMYVNAESVNQSNPDVVMYVQLPTNVPPNHWLLTGVYLSIS